MKKSGVLIAVAAVVILAGAAFVISRGGDEDKANKTTSPPPAATISEPPDPSSQINPGISDEAFNDASVIISYNEDGFSPALSTVKPGAKVLVKNTSQRNLDFASDPHPVHTANTELNTGSIPPASVKTFTASKTGTWGFHNHLRPGDTGTITVE